MVQTSFKKLAALEKGGEEKLIIVEEGKLEPGSNLENLEKGEKEFKIMEEGVQVEPSSGHSGFSQWLHERIWTFFLLTCPYPFYLLIVGISQHSTCVQQYEPIPFLFLIGLFATLELTNFTLFSPPKQYTHCHQEYDIVNFHKPEDIQYPKNGDNRAFQLVHCFFAITALWIWTLTYLEVFGGNVQAEYHGFFISSNIAGASAVSFLFFLHYSKGMWMHNYNSQTLLASTGFLAVTTFSFSMRFACDCSSNFYLITSAIGLLATFLHLRFAVNFQNPPKWICMLTIRHLRQLLVNWYIWFVLCIVALWVSLFALVIGSTNNGSCSEWFFFTLIGSSSAVVVGLAIKLVLCCWSRMKHSEEM